MLISGKHRAIYRRGAAYSRQLDEAFTGRILQVRDHNHHPDSDAAAWAVFDLAFSTLVLRITYARRSPPRPAATAASAETLAEMISRSLMR